MPRRRRLDKRRRSSLSEAQIVELVWGPVCRRCRDEDCHGRICSAFESPFQRRRAYLDNRAEIMGDWRVGTASRPWAFWTYELGYTNGPWVHVDGELMPLSRLGEARRLARAGVLSDGEITALRADALEFGGSDWDIWAAIAGELDLEVGPPPRLHAEELEPAEDG